MHNNQKAVDEATLRPLLNLIAKAESNSNYDAYFGNAANKSLKLTKMPIKDVLSWQADYVNDGSPSSAAGRYQIINTTLAELTKSIQIDKNQPFDDKTQDQLAIALINRRGAPAYVNGKLSAKDFAASLAKEWAALPKATGANPDKSYYASDGLNQSRISVDEILAVIKKVKVKE